MSDSKTEDKVAEAVIDAANKEAEKDEAEAANEQASADQKTVAAAHAAAALAETEAAKAKQRAQEDIEEDRKWVKEQAEISQRNFALLAENQNKLDQKTTALAEAITGVASLVQSLIPQKSEIREEVIDPKKENEKEEGRKEAPPKVAKKQRRFI